MITTLGPPDASPTLADAPPSPTGACQCPGRAEGGFTTTVPREFVHRASVAEVFLTGMCGPAAGDRFHVAAELPRAHGFFTPPAGTHYDPMLICETIRQVGLLIAHQAFEVPLGHQFLLGSLDYTTFPEHLTIGDAPAEVDVDVVCAEVLRRGTRLRSLRYRLTMRRGPSVMATADVAYEVVSPAVYRRLRGPHLGLGPVPAPPADPLHPALVGRLSPLDVVLAAAPPQDGGGTWQLRYDTRHPVLFEYPTDHLPGVLLLEAARQAAVALERTPGVAVLPRSLSGTCRRYAEFDAPLWIRADRLDSDTVAVTGTQNGEEVFAARVGTALVRTVPYARTP